MPALRPKVLFCLPIVSQTNFAGIDHLRRQFPERGVSRARSAPGCHSPGGGPPKPAGRRKQSVPGDDFDANDTTRHHPDSDRRDGNRTERLAGHAGTIRIDRTRNRNGGDLLDLLLDDPRLPTPIDEGHASAREPGSRVTETALTPRRDEANRGGPDTAK